MENYLDTPVATHGFTPRGVLIWENLLKEVISLRTQVNALNLEFARFKSLQSQARPLFQLTKRTPAPQA